MGPSHVSIFLAFSSDTLNSRYLKLRLDVFPGLCTSFPHNLQFKSVELMEVHKYFHTSMMMLYYSYCEIFSFLFIQFEI